MRQSDSLVQRPLVFSFDLETDIIARPRLFPPPVCGSWYTGPPQPSGLGKIESFIERFSEALKAALGIRPVVLIGHNVAFDMACMMAWDHALIEPVFAAYRARRVDDTLIRQKLLDNARGELRWIKKSRGYSLESVAGAHGLQKDGADPWRLKYAELRSLSLEAWPDSAIEYACHDAEIPWQIYHRQADECAQWVAQYGSPVLHGSPDRTFADLALALMQGWGVRANAAAVEALRASLSERRQAVILQLQANGLVRTNGTKDAKAIQARVVRAFEALGRSHPLTDGGAPKADADTCAMSKDPVLGLVTELSNLTNLSNRADDLWRGTVLPLQPRYDSLLETGRTSASKGEPKRKADMRPWTPRGIQVQNNPREKGPRECYAPREDNVILSADYSSAELHTLAQVHLDLFGRSALADLLNGGMDVHMKMGVEAFSQGTTTYEEALARKSSTPFKAWRQTAKPIVFGRPGGMGARRIVDYARQSYGVIIDEPEARRLIKVYERLVPELPDYFRWIDRTLKQSCGLIRQFRSGRWRGGLTYSEAANTLFQGLAADGALAALCAVCAECYADQSSPLFGWRPIAFVHDEIVLEGPIDLARARPAAARLQMIMEREMNVYTPGCPTPAEPVLSSVWCKDAEPAKNEKGELVIWHAT